jgi:hypothetical protein
MTNPAATVDDSQIAAKHRVMWASGDYPKLAAERACPELRGIWVSIHADSMRRYRQARCRGGRVA